MRVEHVALKLPSRIMANADILDLIAKESAGMDVSHLDVALAVIRRALAKSGACSRHWLAADETPLSLIRQVCLETMGALGGSARIDLLIDASADVKLLEPSSANLIAHEIGLDDVECFDLKAACDGWMKAARVASSFIESGQMQRVMIVNAEFGLVPGGVIYPELFRLSSTEQLNWRLPAFTIGEGATATILCQDKDNPWQFRNQTHNEYFDLCTITPHCYAAYPFPSERIARDGAGLFTSYGAELRRQAFRAVDSGFFRMRPEEVDVLFTHSSSKADWLEAAQMLGLEQQLYDIYANCGNLVSASIPAGMARAIAEGRLQRCNRVAAVVVSAGMSFSIAQFRY